MRIIDLNDEHLESYVKCLEEWSDEIAEAGDHKRIWYEKMRDNGLRVKLAMDEERGLGGMIQYVPIELSPAEGEDLYFINCIWVHGYKEGRGNFQKQGMGKALLKACEDDLRSMGVKGVAAWGVMLPFWMRSSFYKKFGYRKADRDGMAELVWKRFNESAKPPRWIKKRKSPPRSRDGVIVTSFINGWCPAQNIVHERAKRACRDLGSERINFKVYDTSNRDTFLEWGISDGLYINGKEVRTGPPPSYESIRKKIGKEMRKI
jgi:GNAT superfamily N-acetyltransferase